MTLQKKNVLHFRWQARDFLRFLARSGWSSFFGVFFLLVVAPLPSFGVGGGGGIITSFCSRPMMLRSCLSSLYFITSMMLL